MKRVGWLPFVLALALPGQASDFFGDIGTTTTAPARASGPVSVMGWVQHKTAYGYAEPEPGVSRDVAALTRFESSAYGQARVRHGDWSARVAGTLAHDWLPDAADAGVWSAYDFTPAQAEARQWQWEWADSYVSWQRGDYWLKGGYQTLAWGEAESLAVTDVLAPRDQRWPGQVDLEQMRLPVPALTLNWRGQLDLVVLDATQSDRLPGPYDEFDAFAPSRGMGATVKQDDPAQPIGFAARWQQRWPGLDVQWMVADVNAYSPTVSDVELGGGGLTQLTVRQERVQVLGVGAQAVRGSWLWRTEQAWHRGTHLPAVNETDPWVSAQEWRGMVGAEYSGWSNLTLTVEVGGAYLLSTEAAVDTDEWRFSQSLRVRWTLLNERVTLTGQGINVLGNEGLLGRLEADWQVSDQWRIGLTLVEYHAWREAQALHAVRNNDAVILNVRLGF